MLTPSDFIQICILIVLFATLLAILRQMVIQNRLFKAQLLRDRFEMYWKTYEPIAEEEIKELEVYPNAYMDNKKYETSYKGNPISIRKYIGMSKLYEFLAFTYALKQLKLQDPMGYRWTELWTEELVSQKEFLDAHEYWGHYYPPFAKFVDELIKKKACNSCA